MYENKKVKYASIIATLRKHSLPPQRKKEEEREHVFIRILISTEPLGLPPWNRRWQNNLPWRV
jgi:hypothetical protein